MSSFVGVIVSDQWLQSRFTQVKLRGLNSNFPSARDQSGKVTLGDLPPVMCKLKAFQDVLSEDDIKEILSESSSNMSEEIDFESFLRIHLAINCEDLAKDGVLLCKLINLAVPGTIDERAINTKKVLNPWERNENHTLCLNSAKAIGCTVVNIGTQDLIEERIQLLADLNLRKTPQLVELVEDSKVCNSIRIYLFGASVKRLLHFNVRARLRNSVTFAGSRKAGYKKEVTNFSSDLKDGEAYAHLLNTLGLNMVGAFGGGNDIVQGNKKLILVFLWQLMSKVKSAGRRSQIESFKDKSISSGKFFLELLSDVEPRVVNCSLVTTGKTDEDKKLNATYIISVARKLGCSIFLLPEDIIEVNQKMMLTLIASIMPWSLQKKTENSESNPAENGGSDASPAATPDGDIASTTSEAEKEIEEER
ncbi:hypothetical protein K7X08_015307 [Anisodus acutangulus]|uniref:Calponin-homology (CH) domain-containing protein n=1 Tax=Anisodus acutangulus TaxID=402998 RepID=A0A9Q1L372_9SOLA|nr:hypothetical protein K7X08_015307 [Anisodus acutangulus]